MVVCVRPVMCDGKERESEGRSEIERGRDKDSWRRSMNVVESDKISKDKTNYATHTHTMTPYALHLDRRLLKRRDVSSIDTYTYY